ncbi:glycoside hydrolase family 13 protein [Flavobacterium succinicans]|uniref:Oligo-1,6-glucosidase n=1 Tax=Flavobacterium succinicans TaxID=29536 RepID=A0A199XNQ3_9FLAO|nr:alpha-glucosidase [Flavobacterium succinicans]OAZ02886.1 oligo-1,6-glucosidase [Flavobacterium succinicans]
MKTRTSLLLVLLLIGYTNTTNAQKKETPIDKKWWKEAIIYQLYPRSFQDSNGDGVGDLKGITQRLDYLQSLGIDAIWLNPICASPNDDNGYDISDYKAIMKEMGTMADFDEMLAGMKKRNIKLIMDLVVNHSSDEHQWFIEAKKSRDNQYRNYYHWWPAEKGTPPKRFSIFDENSDAWRYEPNTNSYYLHYFSRKQPDLNWENPQLRQEMYDIMKFWLDKGVSGFRLDAFPFIAKDTNWPVMPADFTNEQFVRYYGADAKLHNYLREMNEVILSKYKDVYTVGEGGVIPFQKVMDFVDEDRKEINTLYHDEIANIWGRDAYDVGAYQVGRNNVLGMKEIVNKWDKKMESKGWNTVYFTNHDQSRAVSRYGNDSPEFREKSAKMLYTFLLTQRATPYIYNGDEIGMTNIRFKTAAEYNDLQTRNVYNQLIKISDAKAAEYLLNQQELSRDNSRTPMQWNGTKNAGFTTGNPWLTINKNYTTVNVEANTKDKNSILNYAKKLAKIRKENPIFVYGKLEIIDPTNPDVFTYTRELNGKKIIVLLNFTSKTTSISAPLLAQKTTQWIGNYPTPFQKELRPYEAVILEVN